VAVRVRDLAALSCNAEEGGSNAPKGDSGFSQKNKEKKKKKRDRGEERVGGP